ncbi:MAG: SAM-dependent methyltransferase, partial [Pseudomonadota bacterium]
TNPVPADGEWREASPAADATMAEIARRIGSLGGAALIMDYGYTATDRPEGPTLQAMRGHKRAHALDRPGEADLTWLPDFDALEVTARAAATVETWVTTQGQFLAELGIGLRAMALSEARPAATGAIADALERLTMAEAMGGAFKVLAITPAGSPRPLGFDPATALPRRRKAAS